MIKIINTFITYYTIIIINIIKNTMFSEKNNQTYRIINK